MNKTVAKGQGRMGEALARAMAYRLLARAFGRPDGALLADLAGGTFLRDLRSAMRAIADSAEVMPRLSDLAAAAVEKRALVEEHTLLFNPTVAVQAPPYETEYGGAHVFMKAQQLADIAGFYRAFGLQVARAFHERPDHVAAELEFMHVAALQEARALARGQTEKAEVCRDAQAKFLADHLACWLPAYAERLRREDGEGFYAALGGLAVAFVAADGRRLGVEAARARRFRPAKPQPDFECPAGGGEGCAPS